VSCALYDYIIDECPGQPTSAISGGTIAVIAVFSFLALAGLAGLVFWVNRKYGPSYHNLSILPKNNKPKEEVSSLPDTTQLDVED